MCYALKKERAYLHAHDDDIFDERGFFELINRRADGEPVEYITQSASFYGLDFFVKHGVLIPRPETELLVDKALMLINRLDAKNIAEIGVGSGAVSVLLALKSGRNILATDISDTPLEVTAINAQRHGAKIELIKTNLLDSVSGEFDVIISNPPYIASSYELPKPVTFEPSEALFSGIDGMDLIKKIIDLSFERGVKALVCEMGYDQKELVEGYLVGKLCESLYFYKDLSGFWRGFVLSI